jgi:hypothetical protein
MHHLVEEIVEELTAQVNQQDCDINFKPVGEEGYLASSKDAQKVVAVGVINIRDDKTNDIEKIVGAFTINVKKYAWAEAEGFTQDQMIDDLNDEIFSLIGVDEVISYLCD